LQHDDQRRSAGDLRKCTRSVSLPARGPVPLPVGQQSKERGLVTEAWGFLGK
ncbi:unnamed protein product, partial [Ixodes hexagonus]